MIETPTAAARQRPQEIRPTWQNTVDEVAVAGAVIAALIAGSLPALIVALYIS